MRILAVCCHPSPDSFHATLRDAVVQRLETAGHTVTVIDLYAEGFDPAMRPSEWSAQKGGGSDLSDVQRHVDELHAAEALLLVYPTWWYGMPAMMKGWIDRVWQPGVAFAMNDGHIRLHMLSNIRWFAVVTTHGSPWWFIRLAMGEPGRKQVIRGLKQHQAKGCRVRWEALYGVDTKDRRALEAWRDRAAAGLARFFAG